MKVSAILAFLTAIVASATAASSTTFASRARSGMLAQRLPSTGFLAPATVRSNQLRAVDFSRTPASSKVVVFLGAPDKNKPKITRENEPQEYFKTNLDKKGGGERLLDPQVSIASRHHSPPRQPSLDIQILNLSTHTYMSSHLRHHTTILTPLCSIMCM